jgi:hypothetical protein
METAAPFAAKRLAIAAPIARAAPVMKATLPCNEPEAEVIVSRAACVRDAAFCAMAMTVAWVFAQTILGITDASTTCCPSMPTFNCGSCDNVRSLQPYAQLAFDRAFGDAFRPVQVEVQVEYAHEVPDANRAVALGEQYGCADALMHLFVPRNMKHRVPSNCSAVNVVRLNVLYDRSNTQSACKPLLVNTSENEVPRQSTWQPRQ